MAVQLSLEQIQALANEDMQAVNAEILAQLNSEVLLINQLGHYIIAGGGKRIRPLIAVLAARALGYGGKNTSRRLLLLNLYILLHFCMMM